MPAEARKALVFGRRGQVATCLADRISADHALAPGIFHLTNDGEASRFGLARVVLVARILAGGAGT